MSENCTCSTFSRGIYGTIQNSSKHRAVSLCMPCDFPLVYTGLVLTGPVDCPRASCDLGIKHLMLRSHVWDPRVYPGSKDLESHRSLWSVDSTYEISLLRCSCHMRSPGSLCVLVIFSSIAWTRTRTQRVSEGAPSDAVRARADSVRALEQPIPSLADKYGANKGPVEPTNMGTIWTTHDSLRAQNRRKPISERSTCSSFTHGLYGPIWVQQSSENRTNPQPVHPPSLIRVFAIICANWQTRTQSFFMRTAESNQTKLGAHAISVLSCTRSHITVVMYFHNNSLLVCIETNRIKTSFFFEVMSNEKWKQIYSVKKVMDHCKQWTVKCLRWGRFS